MKNIWTSQKFWAHKFLHVCDERVENFRRAYACRTEEKFDKFHVYLIRTNFRADKFSRIFMQNLDLREIAEKLVPNLWSFEASARKLFRAKIFKLHILKKIYTKKFDFFSKRLSVGKGTKILGSTKMFRKFWAVRKIFKFFEKTSDPHPLIKNGRPLAW